MIHLFYIMVLGALIYELQYVIGPEEMLKFKGELKDLSKNPTDSNSIEKAEFNTQGCVLSILSMNALIVGFGGILTNQWFIFFPYVLIGIIFSIIYKYLKPIKLFIVVIDGILSSSLLLMAILNEFHYHYTLLQLWNKI